MKAVLKMLGYLVVFVGLALGVALLLTPRKAPPQESSEVSVHEQADASLREGPATKEALVDWIQKAPEELIAMEERKDVLEPVTEAGVPSASPPHVRRNPKLFSENPLSSEQAMTPEPISVTDLYFWEDFASLRTEAMLDPDSPKNRATVESIMQKRKERLEHQNN